MGKRYLTDTNIIIDFMGNLIPESPKTLVAEIIDDQPYISIVNKIELLGFSNVPREIVEFVETAQIIELTEEVVGRTISLRKKHKIKLPDAIIAATCLVHDLRLITRNEGDFDQVEGLVLFNPWSLQ